MTDHLWSDSAKASVEEALQTAISGLEVCPKLRDGMTYSVFPGGKRIRPLFAIAFCEDLKGEPSKIIPAAAAIELLHCSSLVHDDLPAIDNDDMRRGKPSCHRAFGEATALFAGDAEISLAIEIACGCDLEPALLGQVVRELSRAFTELCDGQQLDLLDASERGEIHNLYRKKTGALFGAACAIGVLGAGGSQELMDAAKAYGKALGVHFQVHDDNIDADPAKGRIVGSDVRNEKMTAVALHGESAIVDSAACVEIALNKIETLAKTSLPKVRFLASKLR